MLFPECTQNMYRSLRSPLAKHLFAPIGFCEIWSPHNVDKIHTCWQAGGICVRRLQVFYSPFQEKNTQKCFFFCLYLNCLASSHSKEEAAVLLVQVQDKVMFCRNTATHVSMLDVYWQYCHWSETSIFAENRISNWFRSRYSCRFLETLGESGTCLSSPSSVEMIFFLTLGPRR